MSSSPSVAANLSNNARKGLAILSLSKAEPIAHLADREGVSRQFLYRQSGMQWKRLMRRLPPGMTTYSLLRDLFNISISVGTVHNRLQSAAR